MLHKMTLKKKYFDLISQEKKTIELRLFDEKRSLIRVGDKIEFSNGEDICLTTVEGLFINSSFEKLFGMFSVSKAGFEDEEVALNVMEEFYPLNKQLKLGVIGVQIKINK